MTDTQSTILEVQGMTCGSCARHVRSALIDLDGVGEADVKLRDGVVIVTHDPTQAPVTQLIDVLHQAGYPSAQRPM